MPDEAARDFHGQSPEELKLAAATPGLSEDKALGLLARRDLPSEALEVLSKNAEATKHRRVLVGIAAHPKTPRHVSIPAVRMLYAFELMQLALSPAVLADIKRAAEDTLISHLEKITLGERLTLARRASGRIAAALLLDAEPRVVEAALTNPFLTEALVVRAISQPKAAEATIQLVCRDRNWSQRREVHIALLRNPHTPAAAAQEFAGSLSSGVLRELLQSSNPPQPARGCIEQELRGRENAEGKSTQG